MRNRCIERLKKRPLDGQQGQLAHGLDRLPPKCCLLTSVLFRRDRTCAQYWSPQSRLRTSLITLPLDRGDPMNTRLVQPRPLGREQFPCLVIRLPSSVVGLTPKRKGRTLSDGGGNRVVARRRNERAGIKNTGNQQNSR